MFAIFNSEGRVFSGPLERLRRVEKNELASAPAFTRSETDDALSPYEGRNEDSASYSISQKAVKQYRSLLQKEGQREPVYHAYQVMSRKVSCINAEWTLSQAHQHLRRYPYQLFPIVNQRNDLVGSMSRQQFYDFLIAIDKARQTDSHKIDLCFVEPKKRFYAADPVTDVRRIAALLVEKKLDALPILEDSGKIVGIVSRTDILRCAVSDPPLSLWA